MSAPLTRRAALAAAAGAVLAVPSRAAADAAADAETAALRGLIAAEDAAAHAYARAGDPRLARQEAAHAAALRPQLEALAQPVPPPARDLGPLGRPGRNLAEARTPRARALAAAAVEHHLLGVYAAALPALRDPGTVRTAAIVMASHGQHLVAASAAAGRDVLALVR